MRNVRVTLRPLRMIWLLSFAYLMWAGFGWSAVGVMLLSHLDVRFGR